MNGKMSSAPVLALCGALLLLGAGGPAGAQSPPPHELVLAGLDGEEHVLGTVDAQVFAPRVSPDGRRVVFETIAPNPESGAPEARLWVAALEGLEARRALRRVEAPYNYAGIWSPDAERIVFVTAGNGPDTLFSQPADGTGEPQRLIGGRAPEDWTADGGLTFLTLEGEGDYGISVLEIASGATKSVIDLPGSAEHSGNVSPDGQWLAYASNETGRFEVWVALLADPDERFRVTEQGGGHPLWSPDGNTLYFDRGNRLYAVEIERRDTPRIGEPVALPIAGFEQGEARRRFDLAPNGRQFLLVRIAAAD